MRRLLGSLRSLTIITAAVFAAAAAIAGIPAAASAASTVTIGPDQFFTGQVNAQAAQATVTVDCSNAAFTQQGYAVAGQTLAVSEVVPPVASAPGYTGDLANSIKADLGTATGNAGQLLAVFTSYGSQEFPTNVLLPCTGSGVVTFDPAPASGDSRPFTVAVTFVPACIGPACPVASAVRDNRW